MIKRRWTGTLVIKDESFLFLLLDLSFHKSYKGQTANLFCMDGQARNRILLSHECIDRLPVIGRNAVYMDEDLYQLTATTAFRCSAFNRPHGLPRNLANSLLEWKIDNDSLKRINSIVKNYFPLLSLVSTLSLCHSNHHVSLAKLIFGTKKSRCEQTPLATSP